ncbi:MAG: hypothetical protein WA172_00515 [Terriglobales bacterium]
MVLTETQRKERRQAGMDKAKREMSEVEKIHRLLVNGRPPSSELRTPAEAVTAARVLYREIESQMIARDLKPKPGEWAVAVAYVSADFSLASTQHFIPGKEAELLDRLTEHPAIMLGLIFGMLDKKAKSENERVVKGVRAFLITKQTVGWLEELAKRADDGMN